MKKEDENDEKMAQINMVQILLKSFKIVMAKMNNLRSLGYKTIGIR
jgi:hypothetical protein